MESAVCVVLVALMCSLLSGTVFGQAQPCGDPVWTGLPVMSGGAKVVLPCLRDVECCKKHCLSVSDCIAIEIYAGSYYACWTHGKSHDLSDSKSSNAVTQYRLDRCPVPTVPAALLPTSTETSLKPSEPPTPAPTPSQPDTPQPTPSQPNTPEPTPSQPDTPQPTPSQPNTPEPTPSQPDTAQSTPSQVSHAAQTEPASQPADRRTTPSLPLDQTPLQTAVKKTEPPAAVQPTPSPPDQEHTPSPSPSQPVEPGQAQVETETPTSSITLSQLLTISSTQKMLSEHIDTTTVNGQNVLSGAKDKNLNPSNGKAGVDSQPSQNGGNPNTDEEQAAAMYPICHAKCKSFILELPIDSDGYVKCFRACYYITA